MMLSTLIKTFQFPPEIDMREIKAALGLKSSFKGEF